jgi:hypothetical protein
MRPKDYNTQHRLVELGLAFRPRSSRSIMDAPGSISLIRIAVRPPS